MKVVGIGPGNIRYASLEAIQTIKNSNRVLAFKRVANDIREISNPIVITKLDELKNYKDGCFVASGDPCLYGVLEYLEKNNIEIEEVVPSISSIQYMFSRLKKPWSNGKIISLHGRNELNITKKGLYIFFTDKINTPNSISKNLNKQGIKGEMYVGYNLSYEDEIIFKGNIGEEFKEKSDLSVVICYVD